MQSNGENDDELVDLGVPYGKKTAPYMLSPYPRSTTKLYEIAVTMVVRIRKASEMKCQHHHREIVENPDLHQVERNLISFGNGTSMNIIFSEPFCSGLLTHPGYPRMPTVLTC